MQSETNTLFAYQYLKQNDKLPMLIQCRTFSGPSILRNDNFSGRNLLSYYYSRYSISANHTSLLCVFVAINKIHSSVH